MQNYIDDDAENDEHLEEVLITKFRSFTPDYAIFIINRYLTLLLLNFTLIFINLKYNFLKCIF